MVVHACNLIPIFGKKMLEDIHKLNHWIKVWEKHLSS